MYGNREYVCAPCCTVCILSYTGRPISQLVPVPLIHLSSLDLSMASFEQVHGIPGPSLDLVHGNSSFSADMDKSLMANVAANAMDKLILLLQSSEPLSLKLANGGREMFDFERFEMIFQSLYGHLKCPNVRIEASRDSGVVVMNSLALVNMFSDLNKWAE